MSSVVYSPLCDKNSALYLAYLFSSVCNGERVVVDESKCGGRDAGADLGSRVNLGSGIACAYRDFCRSTLGQDGLGQVSDSIDDNVVAGSGYDVAVFRGARKIIGVSDSSIASDGGGLDSRGCDGEHEAINTEIGVVIAEGLEKKPVPGAFGKKPIVVVDTKGRNYERNRVNRDKRHARKLKKQAMQGKNWRSYKNDGAVDVPVLDCGGSSPAKDSGASGFWNSCSEDMRRQLIESKARMHVASNNKKAEEDERRVKQLQSPEQILRDAMRLVNFANEQAKAKNDSKVCGWAKTVAESYAETIAKSAPTSVESFESFVQSNSSITSVSIEAFNEIVKIKDEQLKVLDTQSKTLDELNKRIAELELIARSRSNITVKCGVLGKCGEKKSIGNVTTGVSNAKIAQRNTQVSGTIVANSERSAFEIAKSERIMSQEHFLKFGKQSGVFYDGKDVFC